MSTKIYLNSSSFKLTSTRKIKSNKQTNNDDDEQTIFKQKEKNRSFKDLVFFGTRTKSFHRSAISKRIVLIRRRRENQNKSAEKFSPASVRCRATSLVRIRPNPNESRWSRRRASLDTVQLSQNASTMT